MTAHFLSRSVLCAFSLIVGLAHAELQLASPFTDHMVLQREMPVPVWGTAEAGAEVTLQFAGQSHEAVADENGRWQMKLSPLSGSADPAQLTVRSGEKTSTRSDVVVGDVWICSGQSNMQFGRSSVPELKELSEQGIRCLEVKRSVAFTEQQSFEGQWEVVVPSSAVAFGFAHHLKKKTEFPVGIIHASWGSSSIEAWMPADMAEQFPYFKTILAEEAANAEGVARIEAAIQAGKWSRDDDVFMRRHSTIVYNAMIAPLVPYAARGLVWYQGERNTRYMTGMPEQPWYHRVCGIREYDETLKAWISRYRQAWGRDDFQFLLVMLPGYGANLNTSPTKDPEHPTAHSWAWMRESQMAALDLPYTAVANTIDLGDAKDIHPKDKAPIGERLALLLGDEELSRGPVFDKVERLSSQLVVHLTHAAGLTTTNGKPPREFWISDQNGTEWLPAEAVIEGTAIKLSHPDLEAPFHVRYAFTGKPGVNLVNGAQLPAYPFRTDEFQP